MSSNNLNQQYQDFRNLVNKLGQADPEEIRRVLSQREVVEPEPELTSQIVDRLKAKINSDRGQSDRNRSN